MDGLIDGYFYPRSMLTRNMAGLYDFPRRDIDIECTVIDLIDLSGIYTSIRLAHASRHISMLQNDG